MSKRGRYRRASVKRPAETGKRPWVTVMSIILIILIALAVGISRIIT